MSQLSKESFMAMWGVLLDNFRQSRSDMTVAFIYQTFVSRDPHLTTEQFGYAIQQCLVNCKFMPSVNEVFRQLYEPDLSGAPSMPDIDPRYADEYQLNHYNTALNTRNKWEAQHDHQPQIGMFRADRVKEIPGLPAEEIARLPQGWPWPRGDEKRLAAVEDAESFPNPLPLVFEESDPRKSPDPHTAEMGLETRKREAINKLRQTA